MCLRAAAFALGLLTSSILIHAFGYLVVDLPPSADTATSAREAVRESPQRHEWYMMKASEQHRRAADWVRSVRG